MVPAQYCELRNITFLILMPAGNSQAQTGAKELVQVPAIDQALAQNKTGRHKVSPIP
jgi:hypothetical protein